MKFNSENNIVLSLLITGTLLTIIVPLMLPLLPLEHLRDSGSIGDAFGGIANPIAQIVGFVLLYRAYIDLMKHELVFSIFPYTDLDESANLKLETCPECHKPHGNYPPLIFDKLQQLKRHFNM